MSKRVFPEPENKWPDEKLVQLKKMVKDGLTAEAIGAALGVTKNAIVGKCRREKLTLPGTAKREKSLYEKAKRNALAKAQEVKEFAAAKAAAVPPPVPEEPKAEKQKPVAKSKNTPIIVQAIIHPPHVYTRKPLPVLDMDTKNLIHLPASGCKFPVEFKAEEWHMCARRRWGTSPYCEAHDEVCYQPAQVKKRA